MVILQIHCVYITFQQRTKVGYMLPTYPFTGKLKYKVFSH